MLRHCAAALAAASVLVLGARRVEAQAADWAPPSRQMPAMPQMSALEGDWQAALESWFRGVEGVSGVAPGQLRPRAETTAGSAQAKLVRFTAGMRPVVVWSDRNGDGRCDMLEIYRSGTVAVQMLDPDYDGLANVVRLYDASGALAKETRL